MQSIIPVIMSGGSGTRLWPLSTDAKPKQFHALAGERTMIQETASRLSGAMAGARFTAPVAIGNAAQIDEIAAQLAGIGLAPRLIVAEPKGRDTAAVAAIAAAIGRELDPEALVLLAPADHVIQDPAGFRALVAEAAPYARERIVTFGIVPDRPHTGFGYIERGEALGAGVETIARFVEKPDLATAQSYLETGRFAWNAGIFLFSPQVLLEEFAAHAPEIGERAVAAYGVAARAGAVVKLGAEFLETPAAPVDRAVMEKTKKAAVVACDVGWADIGSWSELYGLEAAAPGANVESGLVALIDCAGVLARSEGPAIAACGVSDLVIVATPEAVLVIPKDRAQDVKKLWEQMKAKRAS